jgi:hypothetical protein
MEGCSFHVNLSYGNQGTKRKKKSERVMPVDMSEDERLDIIKMQYDKIPSRHVAKLVGKSRTYVLNRMKILGLVVPEEIKEKFRYCTQFVKGQSPMYRLTGAEGMATRFKKGHIPKNTLHDGAISLRTDNRGVMNYHIRVGLGKWEYLSRYIWRQHNGAIPEGCVITYKDGDTLNCVIDNLEMITRGENAGRNKTLMWYAQKMTGDRELAEELLRDNPELVELYKQNGILKRSISDASKNKS